MDENPEKRPISFFLKSSEIVFRNAPLASSSSLLQGVCHHAFSAKMRDTMLTTPERDGLFFLDANMRKGVRYCCVNRQHLIVCVLHLILAGQDLIGCFKRDRD